MRLPLAGRTIAVTRPREQAGWLADAIERAGGRALIFPLLEIVPVEDCAALDPAVAALDGAALAIFISPNAVRFSLPAILARRPWPPHLKAAAVGQGTARAVEAILHCDVIAPDGRSDSEALLALPALAADRLAGRVVLLFKGEGGRDLLATTLAARGAQVVPVPCYRRLPPALDPQQLIGLADAGRLDAMVLSSSEAAAHLAELLGARREQVLRDLLVVTPHPRIATAARRLGCVRILETAGREGADAGILAALTAYNWPTKEKPTT